jgi:hypothetical protein
MSNDAQKLRSIFLAAVENYPPDQWAAYLDEACSGNEILRQRVEVLLRGHAESHSLLDQAGSDPFATKEETIRERPGTVIGPYKSSRISPSGPANMKASIKELRPYQVRLVTDVCRTTEDVLVEQPTGSGKTVQIVTVIPGGET